MKTIELGAQAPAAVLVAVQAQDQTEAEVQASLDELGRLCETLGFEPVARISQRRSGPHAALLLGTGKVAEIKDFIEQMRFTEAQSLGLEFPEDVLEPREIFIVVDEGISPSQTLHLGEAAGASVLDRNTVILEIFHRHARTRTAQVQVELVRLEYQAPRVRTGAQRAERGGGIGAKGKGESHLELDRRKIRDRIAELRRELDRIQQSQARRRRPQATQVALVGYTNAGKSTLMRSLTGSDVLVADQLFATLDTRVRQLDPPSQPPVVVSDTVGFIKKLPHGLIESFKSTLDEALDAALLLHVIDASSPDWAMELETTRQVLEEIGALDRPVQKIFNKIDRIDADLLARLRRRHPDALFVSALEAEGVQQVRRAILHFVSSGLTEVTLRLGFDQLQLLSEIHTRAQVVREAYDEEGLVVDLRCDEVLARAWQERLRRREEPLEEEG